MLKKLWILSVIFIFTACANVEKQSDPAPVTVDAISMVAVTEAPAATESPEPQPVPSDTSVKRDTVRVPVLCTLMGRSDTQTVPYGSDILLVWGWSAKTAQQMEAFIEQAIITVTFDSEAITGAEQGEIYSENEMNNVTWRKNIGLVEKGKHPVGYLVEFRKQIFDGWDYYGPETENLSIEDHCFLVVE